MIRAVVRADRPLAVGHGPTAVIHYADLSKMRCPRAVPTSRPAAPGAGRTYAVARCWLHHGHDGDCVDAVIEPKRSRKEATFCDVALPPAELWVPVDVRPGDRVCGKCSAKLPGSRRGARVGAQVRFYYDHAPGRGPQAGDALVTDTGKTYLLTDVRLVARGANAGRRTNLHAVVVAGVHDLPKGTVVHTLEWYKRERRRPSR